MSARRPRLGAVSLPRHKSLIDLAREFRRRPTGPEARLWHELRLRRVLEIRFRRQHVLGPYIVDFYAPSIRLAVEVDGPVHRNRERRDQARQNFLESQGVWFVRFTAEEIDRDIGWCLRRLKAEISERGLAPG